MQENSNPTVATGVCDLNKSRAWQCSKINSSIKKCNMKTCYQK